MSDQDWRPAEEQLLSWSMRAQHLRRLHRRGAGRARRLRLGLAVSTLILAAGVAALGLHASGGGMGRWIPTTSAALGGLAAFLATIQLLIDFGARAERHRQAGLRFAAVTRDVENLLALPPAERGELRAVLDDFSDRMEAGVAESPTVNERAVNVVTSRMKVSG